MDLDVPYMPSTKNLHAILGKVQHAAVPETFSYEFLKDLGFTSSNDRAIIKIFKYLGMLDQSGRPLASYREFVDHTKTKHILAVQLRKAYDDLFASNKDAHNKTSDNLKGWFKSKTGKGDAVALKMATTFKSLASYADFTKAAVSPPSPKVEDEAPAPGDKTPPIVPNQGDLGLVYRLEIHLPDTQNIETHRAIFRALREELM